MKSPKRPASLPMYINIALIDGGLGDNIARLPALRYLLQKWPQVTIDCWVPDYFVELAQNLFPHDKVFYKNFRNVETSEFKQHLPALATPARGQVHTSLRTSLVDHAFRQICDFDAPTEQDKEYPRFTPTSESAFSTGFEDKKYVVVTTAFTAKAREFSGIEVNRLVGKIKTELGLSIVFIGKGETEVNGNGVKIIGNKPSGIDYTQGLNLLDKTDLLQAADIMSKAAAVVGVDNGLLHVAATTSVPIVAGFTSVDPKTRQFYRSEGKTAIVVPKEDLACRFCQTNMNFILGHDFRNCYYQDYACVKQLTAERFFKALVEIL